MSRYDVVIVGAGHGGAQTAIALRQNGFDGSIALVGEEPDLPYERPPLCKDYLSGEKAFERILIRPERFWREREVDMILGRRAISVDPEARVVALDDGGGLDYGSLVWAAGGAPRRLGCTGAALTGVHTVRTRADADRMMGELDGVSTVVVVGGGYIGLEAAAALTKLGKAVILLEALDRVLARVAGEPLSRFFEQEHRARGVDIRFRAAVECIEGGAGRVSGVRLVDGETIACQMVIVGIGIVPGVDPLIEAGAAGGNGVRVDACCRTTLPGVYAIGDCALHANAYADGEWVRLESVQNATDQAAVAARAILGGTSGYDAVPWFWSNQYDLKLQTVGLSSGHDRVVVRGDPARRSFSVIYLREGQVIALDCVNAVRDYVQGRALVIGRSMVEPDLFADAATPLRELAR